MRFSVKLKNHDRRVLVVIGYILLGHLPCANALAAREQMQKMRHRKHENPNYSWRISDKSEIRNTAKRIAGLLDFRKVSVRNANVTLFGARHPAAALNGDTHKVIGVWIACDEINTGVIYAGALESML